MNSDKFNSLNDKSIQSRLFLLNSKYFIIFLWINLIMSFSILNIISEIRLLCFKISLRKDIDIYGDKICNALLII